MKYTLKPRHLTLASTLARRGLTDEEIAKGLKVSRNCIIHWLTKPEFKRAVRFGRLAAWRAGLRPDLDHEVAHSNAKRRAMMAMARKTMHYTDEMLEYCETEVLERWRFGIANMDARLDPRDVVILRMHAKKKGMELKEGVEPLGKAADAIMILKWFGLEPVRVIRQVVLGNSGTRLSVSAP